MFNTGIVNGTQTGYILTGFRITNPGSGYNSTYQPLVSFTRQAGDNLTKNATGIFSLKKTGLYSFTNTWNISTGISNNSLISSNPKSSLKIPFRGLRGRLVL